MEKDKINFSCKALIIGGSAGSLEIILNTLPKIRSSLSFPIIFVLHRKNSADSVLLELLAHKTSMPVKEIEDKLAIEKGTIYLAPPDYHVLIEKENFFSLDVSEKINYSRPSIDVTFDSASKVYNNNLACILLSGASADGVQGLKEVKNKGGLVVVQEPSTAEFPFMPQQAIEENLADHILHPNELISFINSL